VAIQYLSSRTCLPAEMEGSGIYTNGSPEGILGICDPRAGEAGKWESI